LGGRSEKKGGETRRTPGYTKQRKTNIPIIANTRKKRSAIRKD